MTYDVINPATEKVIRTIELVSEQHAGQDCCARSRILVERSAYDRFLGLLEPAVKNFKVGDPGDPATEMGPVVAVLPFDPGRRARDPGQPRRRGRELGPDAPAAFTETKNIFISTED